MTKNATRARTASRCAPWLGMAVLAAIGASANTTYQWTTEPVDSVGAVGLL